MFAPVGWDGFGRVLARVTYQTGGRVQDLGAALIAAGLAVPQCKRGRCADWCGG